MSRLLLCDARGPVEDLLQKLSGEEGKIWLEALKKMLRKENPWGIPIQFNWSSVYETLDMSVEDDSEIANLAISETEGLWTVPVLKGLTHQKVVDALKKAGSGFWSYLDDLDKSVVHNDRDPNRDGSYVVAFQATVEADEEFKNLSADQLKEQNHQGITLLERLLLELAYFLATGKHLDVKNVTLCSGSRNRHGGVPSVYWIADNRKVYVYWYDSDDRSAHFRSRSVVSCQSKPEKA